MQKCEEYAIKNCLLCSNHGAMLCSTLLWLCNGRIKEDYMQREFLQVIEEIKNKETSNES